MDEQGQKICDACDGAGVVHWTETRYVSREMALDAGDISMEGMPIPDECAAECQRCHGTGYED